MVLDPELMARIRQMAIDDELGQGRPMLSPAEESATAEGEPYCFRCGRPASSFPEYEYQFAGGDNADYVRNQEGTYNPETNRFACDSCYIAIGTPSSPTGWRAP